MRNTTLKYAAVAIKLAAERALKQAQDGPPVDSLHWNQLLRRLQSPGSKGDLPGRPAPRNVWPEGVPLPDRAELERDARLRQPLGNLRELAQQSIGARRKDHLDTLVAPPWSPQDTPSVEQRLAYEAGLGRVQRQALDERQGLKPSDTAVRGRAGDIELRKEVADSVKPQSAPSAPSRAAARAPKPSQARAGLAKRQDLPLPRAPRAPMPTPATAAGLAGGAAGHAGDALANRGNLAAGLAGGLGAVEGREEPKAYGGLPTDQSQLSAYLLPLLLGAGIGGGTGYAIGDEDEKKDRATRIRNALLGLLIGGGLGVGGAYLLNR